MLHVVFVYEEKVCKLIKTLHASRVISPNQCVEKSVHARKNQELFPSLNHATFAD